MEGDVGKVAALLDELERHHREPKLIDVALDGPRTPAAARITAALDIDTDVLLAGRALDDAAVPDGHSRPIGDHAQEVLEMWLGIEEHNGSHGPARRPRDEEGGRARTRTRIGSRHPIAGHPGCLDSS
jgi:hypothetical protein